MAMSTAADSPELPPQTYTSKAAVWSLVLGMLSFCTFFLTGFPAIILGILGFSIVKSSGGQLTGRRLAIAGIVTGILGTCAGIPASSVIIRHAGKHKTYEFRPENDAHRQRSGCLPR